jgi:hypothetical protein
MVALARSVGRLCSGKSGVAEGGMYLRELTGDCMYCSESGLRCLVRWGGTLTCVCANHGRIGRGLAAWHVWHGDRLLGFPNLTLLVRRVPKVAVCCIQRGLA